MPDLPPDPFAGQDNFVGLHQAYLNMRAGGFTRFEALLFLAANVAVNGFIGQQQDPPPG
jgi:hypothetical protein